MTRPTASLAHRKDAQALAARFAEPAGRTELAEAIGKQALVANDPRIVRRILALGPAQRKLRHFARGEHLMKSGERGRDLHLILAGKTEIWVRGNLLAERSAGEHVGEMACIDPTAPRSAHVIASESTVTLVLTHAAFEAIASRAPIIWKRIACTLGARLRERGARERMANAKPHIFIGSSSERLDAVDRIQRCLRGHEHVVNPWHKVFQAGDYTLEKLSHTAFRADFAVLLLTRDDVTTSRKRRTVSPRDNVVFELGLFVGRLSVRRVFIIDELGAPRLKLPSDLDGVTRLPFRRGVAATHRQSIDSVCNVIRRAIAERGVRFVGRDGER